MLVLAVTSPYFTNINDRTTLANAVGRLIAYAATTSNPDWKNSNLIGSIAQKEEAINNIKALFDGSDYCYYSPNNDNWEWRLCSKNGWPVFVKDAEEWEERLESRKKCEKMTVYSGKESKVSEITSCRYDCTPIQKIIDETYGPDAYNQYLLNVKFGGSECEGLSGYGTAYIEHWQNIMNPLKNPVAIGTYAAICGTTTSICYAAMTAGTGGIGGALSIRNLASDIAFLRVSTNIDRLVCEPANRRK